MTFAVIASQLGLLYSSLFGAGYEFIGYAILFAMFAGVFVALRVGADVHVTWMIPMIMLVGYYGFGMLVLPMLFVIGILLYLALRKIRG